MGRNKVENANELVEKNKKRKSEILFTVVLFFIMLTRVITSMGG